MTQVHVQMMKIMLMRVELMLKVKKEVMKNLTKCKKRKVMFCRKEFCETYTAKKSDDNNQS